MLKAGIHCEMDGLLEAFRFGNGSAWFGAYKIDRALLGLAQSLAESAEVCFDTRLLTN